MEAFRPRLLEAAGQLSVDLSREQQDKLLQYLELLARWNTAYNLSSVREPELMLERHIVDSLSVVNLCGHDTSPLIDMGSGGGLPGVPLAIAHPGRQVTLLDSNGKKTRFLFQVASQLPLPNVQVINERVEKFFPAEPFAGAVSRAFSSIADMIDRSEHLLAPGGKFYAMKGRLPQAELSALPKEIKVEQVHPLSVPGCDAERHLIVLSRPTGDSPA